MKTDKRIQYLLAGVLALAVAVLGGCGGGKSLNSVVEPTNNAAGTVTPWEDETPDDLTTHEDAEIGTPDATRVTAFSGGGDISTSGATFLDMATCGATACHKGTYDKFVQTPHGTAWESKAVTTVTSYGGKSTFQYYSDTYGSNYCVQCHTVTAPFLDEDGDHQFDASETGAFGLSPTSTANTWGGTLGSTTFTSYANVPDEYKGIQCENCHGPGSLHTGNKNFIVSGFQASAAQTCNYCHDQYEEWAKSGHALTNQWGEADSHVTSKSCAPCHNGEGFIEYAEYAEETLSPDVMVFIKDSTGTIVRGTTEGTGAHNVNCVTCHDPHDKYNDAQLRMAKEELCLTCHNGRKKVPGESNAPHHNIQGRVLNGQGIVNTDGKMLWGSAKLVCDNKEFSSSADVTASCGTKSYVYTAATSIEPTMGSTNCVNCHMYSYTNRTAGIEWLGHTFNPRPQACESCHSGMDASNVVGQIQADFTTQYNALKARLDAAAAAGLTTASSTGYKYAKWNLDYLSYDGSNGVHNKDLADKAFEYTDYWLDSVGY